MPGELIPHAIANFIGTQFGLDSNDLAEYAVREETRHEHLAILRQIYSFKMFSGQGAHDLKNWLANQAEVTRSNEDLARRFLQKCGVATQNIPATVSEASYILDGLLINEAGKQIREQYADTGGFTDHVFAVTSLLSYRFIPRIRNLSSKRLYVLTQ